jgi:hypothetical protein
MPWVKLVHRAETIGRGLLIAALLQICSAPLVGQVTDRQEANAPAQTAQTAATVKDGGGTKAPGSTDATQTVPDSPPPQTSQPAPNPLNYPEQKLAPVSKLVESEVIATLPPDIYQQRLTPKDKFDLYVYQNYGPQNFILPIFSAAFEMARPPKGYPREWLDGGGAFGRWYGAQFASSTSNRSARMLAQIAFHEDPRYVPSGSKNAILRISHALMFTFIDKTDSGENTFAFSNFAGAAAGGFVGMGFYPDGHNDMAHAEQRALRGLETIALRNILTEFRPEWEPTLKRIHIPQILPAWWTHRPEPRP